ncbi:MAG: diguanylate cyclase [Sphingomonadales bacterium]|nr:MAG: diguanylate cyclase [Sphingomonadales bacterium]
MRGESTMRGLSRIILRQASRCLPIREDILLSPSMAGTPEYAEIRVTISMGLAHPGTGSDAAKLLADADRPLYAAKHGGRNQLRIAA